MKILLPTAKQLSVTAKEYPLEPLQEKTKTISKFLSSKTEEELAKIYKIKLEQAQVVKNYFDLLSNGKYNCYKAIELFDGLMYRNIKIDNNPKAHQYLDENVYITSSLYGVISANSLISKHRLDFLQPVNIDSISLKEMWRQDYDNAVNKDEIVISLLSSEFEEVFSKQIRDKFIKIVFMENKNGELKIHSTISKKARGKFLSELVNNQINSVDAIKNIKFDGFNFRTDLSAENKLVFVKE